MRYDKKYIILKVVAFTMAFGLSLVYPYIYAADFHQKYSAEAVVDTCVYQGPDKGTNVMSQIEEGESVSIVSDICVPDGSVYLLVRDRENTMGYIPQIDVSIDYFYSSSERIDADNILVPDVFCLAGNIFAGSYERLVEYYHLVPEKIRDSFEKDGFHIIMMEQDITPVAYAPYGGFTGWGYVEGVMDYELQTIYMQDESSGRITHEMGHYINDKLHCSSQPGFSELVGSEAAKISTYAQTNPNEFFAETFDLYVRDPQALATISPAAYQYMDGIVHAF